MQAFDFTSEQSPAEIVKGNRVKLATAINGANAGEVYAYIGATVLMNPDLGNQPYTNGNLWEKIEAERGIAGRVYEYMGDI